MRLSLQAAKPTFVTCRMLQATQTLASWLGAQHGDHAQWREVTWMLLEALPALLGTTCLVAPSPGTEPLRCGHKHSGLGVPASLVKRTFAPAVL